MQDSDVKEIFSAIKMLKDKVDNLEKKIKELQNGQGPAKENVKVGTASQMLLKESDVNIANPNGIDPYSKSNFIDRGDYIELVIPLVVVDENCKRSYIKAIQKSFTEKMIWYEAKDYARELRLGGFDDWRVPTKEELYEIYKIRNISGITISEDAFWSSSTSRSDKDNAWFVDFDNGGVDDDSKVVDYYVRCVR